METTETKISGPDDTLSEFRGDVLFRIAKLERLEQKISTMEGKVNELVLAHNAFMTGLEDASRELMKNDIIRVTIPKAFRDKIQEFLAKCDAAKAAANPAPVEVTNATTNL